MEVGELGPGEPLRDDASAALYFRKWAIGFALVAAARLDPERPASRLDAYQVVALVISAAGVLWALGCLITAHWYRDQLGQPFPPPWVFETFGIPLTISIVVAKGS